MRRTLKLGTVIVLFWSTFAFAQMPASPENKSEPIGLPDPTTRFGSVEITSDTMGVDFGPYLQQVVHAVRQNWYNIIPPSAKAPLYKKGKLSIEFVILKNGKVGGMHYVISSGDVALDRAAYGGITYSNPFRPLPEEFVGQYLGLRFTFLYNPDASWKEYVFGEDGFAITLPADPSPHPDAALPDMTVYTVSLAPGSGLSLRVSHQNRDCSATLGQLKDGGLQGKAGIDPASVKEVSFGGHPGIEFQSRIGSDRISSDRFYCVNGRFYAFSTNWPSAHPRPQAADRIVNSFRLVNATASNFAPISLGDKKPDTGSMSGHVYRNEFFRFTYTLPEDFKPGASGPEGLSVFIDGRNSFFLVAGSNPAPQSSGELPSEVHVTAWSEPSLWGGGWREKTGSDYLTKIRTMTPNFEPVGPIKKRTIAGITFYEADAKTNIAIPGLPRRFQKALVRTTEIGYILQFVLLANSEEELERLDHSFESIHFESQ